MVLTTLFLAWVDNGYPPLSHDHASVGFWDVWEVDLNRRLYRIPSIWD